MIRIKQAQKRYGKLHVLKNVGLHLRPGRITGLIGPNGSGKSTLIKALLGLISLDSGSISFDGKDIRGTSDYRKNIGYIPQRAHFPANLTVSDLIHLIKDIRGEVARLEPLWTNFSLAELEHKKVKTLSGGSRQKVSSYLAFLYNPKLLVMDEPTASLDPVAASHLKQQILAHRNSERSVLITSHIMPEVQQLADDIIFINDGVVQFNGPITTLQDRTGKENLEDSLVSLLGEQAI